MLRKSVVVSRRALELNLGRSNSCGLKGQAACGVKKIAIFELWWVVRGKHFGYPAWVEQRLSATLRRAHENSATPLTPLTEVKPAIEKPTWRPPNHSGYRNPRNTKQGPSKRSATVSLYGDYMAIIYRNLTTPILPFHLFCPSRQAGKLGTQPAGQVMQGVFAVALTLDLQCMPACR